MVRCTFKILRCSHHKIFKVYLVIFQQYAFLPIIISITSKFKGKIQNDEDLVLIRCPLLTNNVTVPFFNYFKSKIIWKTEKI